jgi:hypothetical protein
MAGDEGYYLHLASIGVDGFGFGEGLAPIIVTAFYVDVGSEGLYEVDCGGLVEDGDVVHATQGSNYLGTLVAQHDGAAWTLVASRRGVRVDAYDEYITQGAGSFKISHMAHVKDVESAVGEDKPLPFGTQTFNDGG